MKCKFKQLEAAMEHFRYSIHNQPEAEVEVTTRDEEFEKGTLMSCIIMAVSYKQQPSQYERNIGEKTITRTIEVFSDTENRSSIVTTQETYELLKKS